MTNDYIDPIFIKQCIQVSIPPDSVLCLRITSQKLRFPCLLNGLTLAASVFALEIFLKPSNPYPYDNVFLGRVKKPESQ
nr:hypothetical protein HmN_000079400 [Hymenolepis microstoma]